MTPAVPAPCPRPGTLAERGIRRLKRGVRYSTAELEGMRSYDLPFGMDFLRRHRIFQYLPVSPTFAGYPQGLSQSGCGSRARARAAEGGPEEHPGAESEV